MLVDFCLSITGVKDLFTYVHLLLESYLKYAIRRIIILSPYSILQVYININTVDPLMYLIYLLSNTFNCNYEIKLLTRNKYKT
jgi:hypothetical protein